MKTEEEILTHEPGEALTEGQRIRRQVVDGILDLLGLSDWVTYSKVMQQVFFFLFIISIGILHVYNSHQAEGMNRKKIRLEKEIKELRWEYMSVKSDLMQRSKLSDIEKALEHKGLKTGQQPPLKIVVKRNER
jgi:hypothetical protein